MKFCAGLSFADPDHFLEIARVADEHGWDTVMLSDHVVHPERIRAKYPYSESGERGWSASAPWPDVWVTTGMMAAVTERLRFMQGVYILPLRDPFSVAKALGTAARLSGYRVSLGTGLGWLEDEFELLGAQFRRRGRRADEMIEVMRKLWTGRMVEHHGEFYDFDRLQMSPGLEQPVPIIIGGNSPGALRRAARLGDGWMPAYLTVDQVRKGVEQIRALRRENGWPDSEILVYGACPDAVGLDGYRRMRDAGFSHALTVPWLFYGEGHIDISLMERATPEQMKDGLRRFADDVIAKL